MYSDRPDIARAQRKLYDLIGDDQVVWCVPVAKHYIGGEIGRYFHELEIDSRDVVAIIDTFLWYHIIEPSSRYIPLEEHRQLKLGADTNGEGDESNLHSLEDKYLADHLPDDLWLAVRKPEKDKATDEVVVKFPFTYSTIRSVQKITKELAEEMARH